MPHEEPDSTSSHPVEHGHEEPSEDRAVPPLSSTNKGRPVNRAAFSIWNSSNLGHSRQPSQSDGARDCCTSVVHNRGQTAPRAVRPKPSGNGRSEPSQRLPSRSRRTPGLIVRGTHRSGPLPIHVRRTCIENRGFLYKWPTSLRAGAGEKLAAPRNENPII